MIFSIRLKFIHGQCSHLVRTPDLHGWCCMLCVHPGPQAVRLEAISERPTQHSYYRMLIIDCLLECKSIPSLTALRTYVRTYVLSHLLTTNKLNAVFELFSLLCSATIMPMIKNKEHANKNEMTTKKKKKMTATTRPTPSLPSGSSEISVGTVGALFEGSRCDVPSTVAGMERVLCGSQCPSILQAVAMETSPPPAQIPVQASPQAYVPAAVHKFQKPAIKPLTCLAISADEPYDDSRSLWMRVTVKATISARAITLNVLPSDTIYYLKKQIQREEGIPHHMQQLFVNGCSDELENDKHVSDYDIQDESTIRLDRLDGP